MAKIKLTKNELKKQKDSLKRFNRFLPTLKLKKKQLQSEVQRVYRDMHQLSSKVKDIQRQVSLWVDVFAEDTRLERLLQLRNINTEEGNIAGIDIPLYVDVELKEQEYDFMTTPLWVDRALEVSRELIGLKARLLIAKKQRDILKEELRIIIQRVNLFEKVKIPESSENIRVINIHLGDLQTADVVRGKLAKIKIEKKKEALPA
ncbi:V-type ATP synthase subunit D [Candidatus Omnitrophota bacterium]